MDVGEQIVLRREDACSVVYKEERNQVARTYSYSATYEYPAEDRMSAAIDKSVFKK